MFCHSLAYPHCEQSNRIESNRVAVDAIRSRLTPIESPVASRQSPVLPADHLATQMAHWICKRFPVDATELAAENQRSEFK